MKNPIYLLLVFICFNLNAQQTLPVLRTNTHTLSIRDGETLRKDYWTVDPSIPLDVYIADKINAPKSVVFYSDIDSLTITLAPRKQYDFWVVLNDKDSCLNRVKSGLPDLPDASTPITRDTIPFVLTDANNIIIPTVLNGRDTLRLMFHTAQGSVSLTENAVKKLTQKTFDHTTQVNTWGGSSNSRYSKGNTLKIDRFEWKNVTLWEDKNTGPGADGKFGPNLFKDQIIELNFDQQYLVIHSHLPELTTQYEQMDLYFRQGLMFVHTDYYLNQQHYPNKVLLHSGYGGTLLLDDAFVQRHKLHEQLEVISESQLKDSHDYVLKTKKALLPQFQLGQQAFTDLPVYFFEGSISRQSMSVLGAGMLKRFNLIIDTQHAVLYLQPSRYFAEPFDRS